FFQAEDGIRDGHVTGVQTCALPICTAYLAMKLFKSAEMAIAQGIKAVVDAFDPDDRFAPFTPERAQHDPMYRKTLEAMLPEDFRSEERRVGKECRARWEADS